MHTHMLLVYYVCPPAWCSTSLPRPPAPPPLSGLTEEKAARVASSLGFTGSYHKQAVDQLVKLYHVFTEYDATMVEINPLTEDSNGKGKHRHCTSVGWGWRTGAPTDMWQALSTAALAVVLLVLLTGRWSQVACAHHSGGV